MKSETKRRLRKVARITRLLHRLVRVAALKPEWVEGAKLFWEAANKTDLRSQILLPLLKKVSGDSESNVRRSPAEANNQGFRLNVRAWNKLAQEYEGADPRTLVYYTVRLESYLRSEHEDLYNKIFRLKRALKKGARLEKTAKTGKEYGAGDLLSKTEDRLELVATRLQTAGFYLTRTDEPFDRNTLGEALLKNGEMLTLMRRQIEDWMAANKQPYSK